MKTGTTRETPKNENDAADPSSEQGRRTEEQLYVMLIERGKTYNRINGETVRKHVDRIRHLDDEGKLVLCGSTKGYTGVGGMIIFRAGSREEAEDICKAEPFVTGGFATYKLFTMRPGTRENNYLL